MLCPCGSGKMYAECCGMYHKGILPTKALELMRSRYSGYALNLADYIMETTHPDNPHYQTDKAAWKKSLQQYNKLTLFDGLTIIEFTDGDLEAFVTFHAQTRQRGRDTSFTERSRFLKVNGRWLYHSGVMQ